MAEQEAFLDFEFNPTEGSFRKRNQSRGSKRSSKNGQYELFMDPFDNQG